jgi:Bacterial Ig domain/Fibronectin type III domain/Protein of unknown function (DUF642)
VALSGQVAQAALVPLASTMSLTLAWNPVPETNIQGYRLYVGTASNQYAQVYETGNTVSFSVGDLVSGQTYYFAVKAVAANGAEGEGSEELIVPVSSRPKATFDTFAGSIDERLTISAPGVLANDTDMDSTRLYAALVSSPANGTVVLNPDGSFDYTPNTGFTGKDPFVYQVSDGVHFSDTAVVEIVVKEPTSELLVNGSFESNYLGWSVQGNQNIAASVSPYKSSHGSRLVSFNGLNLPANGVLSQSFATVPGKVHTVSFDTAVLAYNTSSQKLLVTVTGQGNLLSQTVTTVGNGTGVIQWTKRSYSFLADSALTTLTFKDTSASSTSIDLLLDNTSVTGPPKPITIPTLAESPGTPSLAGTPGAVTVGMTVVSSGLYILERSEDLVHWEAIGSTQVTEPGLITFVDSKKPGGAVPKVFYRIGFR